ncbi:MAG TPA: helix-turn-helix domain-containing protein [Saprospiraceae bacterium]|nr:helix-turn-helix domain-containing protein [Saprospiraceae bacterium]
MLDNPTIGNVDISKPSVFITPDIAKAINNKKLSKSIKTCCPKCQTDFLVDDPWLHTKEAAAIVGFEPDTLVKHRHLDKRRIPFLRIGRTIRYPLSGLIDYKAQVRKEMEEQLMP